MQPQAIVIAVGDELVSGAVPETNSRFACQLLGTLGVAVRSVMVVGDSLDYLARMITKASQDAELVVVSGGLGPTGADRTREALARALSLELEFKPDLLAEIVFYFTSRGKVMPAANRQQAYLPAGAQAIPNPVGTAPGVLIDRGSRLIVALPGVPFEFCNMVEGQVLDLVHKKFAATLSPYGTRNLLVTGVSESALDEKIRPLIQEGGNPRLGLTSKEGAITLRLVAHGKSQDEIDGLLASLERELRARLGSDVAEGYPASPEEAVASLAPCRRIAVADAVTGGHLAARLAEVGVEVASWAGGIEFLAAHLPAVGAKGGAVEAAAGAAAAAGVEAGLALWPAEGGLLFAAAVLGEKAYEVVVVPTASPETNRFRLVATALDLLRRLVQGIPAPDDREELQALAALAEDPPAKSPADGPGGGPAPSGT